MITMFIWVIPYSFIRKLLFVKGFYTQTNKIIPGMVINKRVHVNRHAQKTFYIKVFADDKNKEFVVSRENFNNYAIEQRIKIRKEFISHKGQLVRTELYLVNWKWDKYDEKRSLEPSLYKLFFFAISLN